MRDIHIGLSVTVPRGAIMITAFFSIIDSIRRHTALLETETGMFITASSAAVLSFWVIWPLEVLKNLV